VYGSYVDEVVAYVTGTGAQQQRFYPHYNHLYSVAALTDASGNVVERYSYDAYGKQTITDAGGLVVRTRSAVGFDRGFTGYITDNETGLLHARARQYSTTLGRFIGRDPISDVLAFEMQRQGRPIYVNLLKSSPMVSFPDGFSAYSAYFVPNRLDFNGLACCNGSAKYDPAKQCCTPDGVVDKVENDKKELVCPPVECPEGTELKEGGFPPLKITGAGGAAACKAAALMAFHKLCDKTPCPSACKDAAAKMEQDCTSVGDIGPWNYSCCAQKKP